MSELTESKRGLAGCDAGPCPSALGSYFAPNEQPCYSPRRTPLARNFTMSLKPVSALGAAALLVLASLTTPVFAQTKAAAYKAPRTVDGQPDMQGVWTNATLTPVERPTNLGD